MKVYTLAVFCTAILTVGCAVDGSSSTAVKAENPKYIPPNWNDPATVQAKINVKVDEFTKQTTYVGPDFGSGSDMILLRAWTGPRSPNPPYQIYVQQFGLKAPTFYAYYDADGMEFETIYIASEINRCNKGGFCGVRETVAVSVTREYLQQFSKTGLRFKLAGKNQDSVYEIPAGYIQGFLSVVPF